MGQTGLLAILVALGCGAGWAGGLKLKRWATPLLLALLPLGFITTAGFTHPDVWGENADLSPPESPRYLEAGMYTFVLAASSLGWTFTRKPMIAFLISAACAAVSFVVAVFVGLGLACSWYGGCV